MYFEQAIFEYAPNYWDNMRGANSMTVDLHSADEEFQQIAYEVRRALSCPQKRVKQITRVQNLHDLGQLLLREQLLLVVGQNPSFFRVRRYIKLKKCFLEKALKFNLDYRRCGLDCLIFNTAIDNICLEPDDVIVVVQVVTPNPDTPRIAPNNNLEYFIDYIVHF